MTSRSVTGRDAPAAPLRTPPTDETGPLLYCPSCGKYHPLSVLCQGRRGDDDLRGLLDLVLPRSVVLWDPVRRFGEWDVEQRNDAIEHILGVLTREVSDGR